MKLEKKMKTVFKASLLASAMALSFGGQAATVSSTPLTLSAEGVAQGEVALNQDLTLDIVVSTQHPSASTITLTFDASVDLDDLDGGAVSNTPASGTGTAGAGDIIFDYGTGSFTFDNVVIDTTTDGAHTISFQVNLGNPLTADSAFRMTLDTNKIDISGASTISYSASTSAAALIETGSGVIADTASQFSFVVATEYDGLIDRTDRTTFTPAGVTDVLTATFTNDESLPAALTGVNGTMVLEGDFTDLLDADFTSGFNAPNVQGVVNAVDDSDVTYTFVNADTADLTGGDNTFTSTFVKTVGGTDIPQTGDINVVLSLDAVNGDATTLTYNSNDGGKWALDASIVNVPYLPVGYGLSPNVEIANVASTDASIQVEGFDQFGTQYGPTTLSFDAKGKTVTKVSEANLQAAFGLATTDKRKLSVTFVLDADADKITLAPYYREGESRVNVMSDQYKADDLR
jgi:hypothetical protein